MEGANKRASQSRECKHVARCEGLARLCRTHRRWGAPRLRAEPGCRIWKKVVIIIVNAYAGRLASRSSPMPESTQRAAKGEGSGEGAWSLWDNAHSAEPPSDCGSFRGGSHKGRAGPQFTGGGDEANSVSRPLKPRPSGECENLLP